MGTHEQLGVLVDSFLHQLLFLLGRHGLLHEVERSVDLLHFTRPRHPVLPLEHAREDLTISVVLASLHLYQQFSLNIIYPRQHSFLTSAITWEIGQSIPPALQWNLFEIFQYNLMRPNLQIQMQQGYRHTYQPQSSHFIPPSNHNNHSEGTPIKKIQDYSYALSDEIGLGLTSRVYKGKNNKTGQPAAIKVIDLKNSKEMQNEEFLKEEIATLQKIKTINAAHLLRLEAVYLTSNNIYIITEYCEGKDMGKILRQRKNLTEAQAQSVMRQLIRGYGQLYSLGLIHRDLKLSNLFVTGNKIKLADFGFAISENRCNQSFSYNAGSPKYMAPESLKYNLYSFKSDVWAMGIMAYELVYGQAPWRQKDDARLYDLIHSVAIENLFDPSIQVSQHYKSFITNCLKPNTAQRANPDYVFGFSWPQASDFVIGFEQEVKIPEYIVVPGKNYAVFDSSNKVSYESKKMDVQDFVNNNTIPTQFVLLSQLNMCKFIQNIMRNVKAINTNNNQVLNSLVQELAVSMQIIEKVLGETACMQKNRLQTPNFEKYITTGEWQNLKQLIIRYDLEFRNELQGFPPLRKNSSFPKTYVVNQAIALLKSRLPENARLLDKLLTFYEVRQILTSSSPMQFAQRVNMASIAKEAEIPESQMSPQVSLQRVSQRLGMLQL